MKSLITRCPALLALAAIALTAATRQAGAATITSFQEGVSPTGAYTHDATYIRSGTPAGNFDGDTDLELIVGTTAPVSNDVLRSLLEFDVSAIPATDQIDSASLVLTTHSNVGIDNGGETGNPTFNVYEYDFDIVESVSTWDDPDGNGNGGTGDLTDGGTLGTFLTSASFDVTATGQPITFGDSSAFRTAVSDALAGDGFLRLIVAKSNEGTGATHEFARFAADSFGTTGNRPKLVVEHESPEPATMSLLALGGLALVRRRRNRA